ncbi:ORF2 [Streptococcus phage 7201]|uniref:ORF2 n=1 Tax=Streptococcus phage 7201 TaxID=2905727 RepID=Q9MCM9_9CAUD|nr:ORF2 [Streptococcus phage 7201]AAF43500.1 ORF2 [Streptococcus phage 7201]
MNEIALSNNLSQIELEIKHHKQIAGQSIWEIGRRLQHVKENNLVHGDFGKWLDDIKISHSEARKMMTIAKQLSSNRSTLNDLGTSALYLIATLPEEEKQEQIEKIEQGESPTVRELQEVRRRLKLKDQALEAVKGELERVKRTKTTEKIIEKEVIPQDYKATQDLNKQLLGKKGI